MSRLVPLLGWVALIAGLWALLRAGGGDEPEERTFVSMLAYALDPEVRFALTPGEAEVKVVVWLASADDWSEDMRVASPFAMDLDVAGPSGQPLRSDRVWVTTRRSSVEDAAGHRHPTAWLAEGEAGARLSEDRLVRIDLSGLVPEGGTLRVRPSRVDEGAQLLVVAFRRSARAEVARLRLQHGDGVAFREKLIEDLAAPDWASIPAVWRAALTRDRWERLGALPGNGGVVETTRLLTTFEHTSWPVVAAEGMLLPPGGAAAWNLKGKTTWEAAWTDAEGRGAGPVAAAARLVRADGTVESLPLSPSDRIGPWELDADVVSLQVALAPDSPPRRLRAWTRGDAPDRSWGDPPRLRQGPDGAQAVGPDVRSIELFRAAPDVSPLRYPAAGHRLVRLQLRPRLAVGPLPGLAPGLPEAPCRVHLEARDDAGIVLQKWDTDVASVPSAFERYTQVDTPGLARVTTGEARLLVLPAGTAELWVAADAVVDVAARTVEELDLAEHAETRYGLPAGAAVDTLYVPMARDRWRALGPLDVEALADARRVVRIDAQVRLEPDDDALADGATRGAGVGVPVRSWWPLPLAGPFELLAEPASPRSSSADDVPGARVRLGSAPATVTVPADGRLRIDYRVPTDRIGERVQVRLGEATRDLPIVSGAGVFELGPLPPGPLAAAVGGAGTFLARSIGAPAWRVRRAWQVEPGRVLSVAFPGGAGAVALHVYLEEGESGWLSWTVEDVPPSPPGVYARITERNGFDAVRPTEHLAEALSFREEGLVPAEPVVIPLGDDVGRERGRITVSLEGTRAPAWIRATATWPHAEDEAARHWTRGAPG